MSKRSIESYIPQAIDTLQETFGKEKIPSEYNGYISAFGASVIQSGLKPTLALFENDSAQSKSEKKKLITIMLHVLLGKKSTERSLLAYVLANNESLLKPKILDVAVAVKLSIRTFSLNKGERDE